MSESPSQYTPKQQQIRLLVDATETLQALNHIIRFGPNKEPNHLDADNLLCNLLAELGYNDVVETYRRIEKWYA